MFNIDFEDRRVKSGLRALQYSVLTVLVLAGATLLVLAGLGYDFNRQSGVIHNGLLLANSVPEGAQVLINGQPESDVTPSRFALPAGSYDIQILSEGYRAWSKTVNIIGSGVEWLYYPFLIPNELVSTQVTVFRSLVFAENSPNGQFLLIRQDSNKPNLSLLSINDRSVNDERSLSIPEDLINITKPGDVGQITFEDWASDNRHVLLRHRSGDKIEYLLVDIEEPDSSRNLTEDFDLELRDLQFIDGNFQQYYALHSGDLRRLNLADGTVSSPLARRVNTYVTHGNNLLTYLYEDDEGTAIGLIEGEQPGEVVSRLEGRPERYRLDLAQFDSVYYLAVLDTSKGTAELKINPQNGNTAETESDVIRLSLKGANTLSFSNSNQFVLLQAGSGFASYDLDHDRSYKFSVKADVDQAYWMDGYRLLATDNKNSLHMFEFDGGNPHELAKVNSKFESWFDSDFQNMYFISPTTKGNQFLTNLNLRVP